MNQKKERKEAIDYAADLAAWVLGGAMFIYLGYRTLDFFIFTFRDEDVIFAYLGLFSTTIGAIIFALIWKRSFYFDRSTQKWRSDEFRKTISLGMMVVCALGELIIAVADMTIISDMRTGIVMMTEGDMKSIMWFTAGLAGLVGAAIAAIKLTPRHPKTDPEIDMSEQDTDNNGILDHKEPAPAPMKANAANAPVVDFDKIELQRRNSEMEKRIKEIEKLLEEAAQKPTNPTNGQNQI